MPELGDYEMPSVQSWVCACLCVFVTFLIKLYISFSYEEIFKFAENVYGCENMSVKKYGTHY